MLGKVRDDYDDFQYAVKRPINSQMLISILVHAARGLTLLSEISSPEPTPNLNKTKSEFKSLSVLLADDSELIRCSLQRQLAKHTKNITACEDGDKLVKKYQNSPKDFDLLIVDNQMPIMNGIDAIDKIRKYEVSNKINPIPIICMEMQLIYSYDWG